MTDTEQLDICGVTVVPIAPGSKYCIIFEEELLPMELSHAMNSLGEWWESDDPFLVLHGGMKLVRVDEAEDEEMCQCGTSPGSRNTLAQSA